MCVKQNIPETGNRAQSSLQERLLKIRRSEEAAIAAEEEARAAAAAKRERLGTVLSRRWADIEAHLREAGRVVKCVFGDNADVSFETKVSHDNSFVELCVFEDRGRGPIIVEGVLTEVGARVADVTVSHGEDTRPLLHALDETIANYFEEKKARHYRHAF